MQISENLLRVIFLLSTIVAVTDCCSSRLLLLKEHTLQIVQHRLHNINSGDESDYEYDNYDQLQQQQQQQQLEQQQQQQKMPQYVDIIKSDIEFNKSYTDEHIRSRNDNEENSTDTNIIAGAMQLRDLGMDSFESLLGIFDAAAFETTTTTTTTTMMSAKTATEPSTPPTTTTTTTEATITTTVAVTTTTTTEQNTISQTEESSTKSSSTVPTREISVEPITTTTTSTTSTIESKVESVMNDLKSVRDLLSLPCSGQFNTEFCLNRGRCFRYPIGNDTIHSCICADGYIGERCESKSMNGSFVPSIAGAHKKKIVMARIVFSFPMLVALSVIYIMIGATIVFKRPTSITETEISVTPAIPPSLSTLLPKETFDLLNGDEDAGEFIIMNSYPIAAVQSAASYSTYTD